MSLSELSKAPSASQARVAAAPQVGPIGPRRIGLVNGRGLWTLYRKEVQRFLNVFTQTVMAPVVTTLLFLAIFTLALSRQGLGDGFSYAEFLAPGLVVMAIVQNSFANTSSSMVIAKIQGNIVDVLMPPLSAWELVAGFAAGGLTRGLLVGTAVTLVMSVFVTLPVVDPLAMIFYAVNASLALSLLGLLAGIWSEKFDHLAAVTNFVIMPLSFLSGTFYALDRLPESWQSVALVNPFFYMIDGFRYGVIGQADASLLVGAVYLVALNVGLFALAYRLVDRGWHLKA
ncbi:MAG: ABC transporter permease [Rhodospirillales bacterium]